MIDFKVDVKGINLALTALQMRGNTRKALAGVGQVVKSQTQQRIQHDKRSPDGQAWPKWSPEYAKTRHANQSLLISSGRLNLSITYDYDDTSVVVGTNQFYAKWLQEGTKRMPRREFLGLSNDDVQDVQETIVANLKRLVSRA